MGMTGASEIGAADLLEVYWAHGCSSCLRMKEFVDKLGVPYASFDVTRQPALRDRLKDLGLAVPCAVMDGQGIPGIDLVGIARLVGVEYSLPVLLPPPVLKDRYDAISESGVALINDIPESGLDHEIGELGRNVRALALHIVLIMRGFVVAEETNVFTDGWEFTPDDAGKLTGPQLIKMAQQTRKGFDHWWEIVGREDAYDRLLESRKHGQNKYWTLHSALERAVWHTAQHTRQLEHFLKRNLRVVPSARLARDVLTGLSLPEGLYARD